MEKIIVAIVEVKSSVIGKRMMVNDNSYVITKDGHAEGSLYGKIVEIISEPFEEFVESVRGYGQMVTFVYGRSIESGIVYRVIYSKSWIVNDNSIPKTDVRGRHIILSDGSFSYQISGGYRKLHGIDREPMIIVSKPYIKRCGDVGCDKTPYVCVDAYSLRDYKLYSVLFNEADLQPEEAAEKVVVIIA